MKQALVSHSARSTWAGIFRSSHRVFARLENAGMFIWCTRFVEGDSGMNIKIINLTEENLGDAPEWGSHPFSCKYCVYWEYSEESTDPAIEQKQETFVKKLGWLKRVSGEFGTCGKLVYGDGEPIGYGQYAPHRYLPGSAGYAAGPPSDDAVLISCLFIPQAKYRRLGIGSRLLHSIIDELKKQKRIKAIETFARKGSPDNP